MPGWVFAHSEDDLNVCILRMFEGMFSLDAVHIVLNSKYVRNSIAILLGYL